MYMEDFIGRKFGKLLVEARGEDYISPNGVKLKRWKCRCECGNVINVTTSQLKRGQKSCGCISTRDDLTGRKYNNLTVLYAVDDYVSPKGAHMSRWHCKCDCGNEVDVLGMSLKDGSTKSCGCISNYNHGISHKRVYPEEVIGNRYGYLIVKECKEYKGKISNAKFLCKCDCGKEKIITYGALIKNEKISCGCKDNKKVPHKRIQAKSVINEKFGELTVLEELEPHITPNGSKQRIVKCLCSCGNTLTMRLTSAKQNGKCTNCLYAEKRVDITGKKFGKLTVISMADDYISPAGHRLSQCNCLCDCGKTTTVMMSGLVTGSTKSCGCILNTRGMLKDNKELMKHYDFELNKDIDLSKLTARCNTKVWWKCEKCGESWLAQVASQNDKNKQHGCPYCSGRLVIKGKNDLMSQYPNLVEEWDFEKNKVSPDEVHAKSSRMFGWICKTCGKKWKATPGNRSYNNSGCPHCNKENVNSFCEQALFYYVRKAFADAINSDTHLGMELDIYIPSINVALEYDGEAWHRSSKKKSIDIRKNRLCTDNNITLIRIREPKLEPIEGCVVFVRKDSTTDRSLDSVIKKVLKYLKVTNVDVDVEHDSGEILAQYASKKKSNSLAACYPEIAAEFHPTKNGKLTPDMVSKSARRKVWWLGKCGHEWDAIVSERTRKEFMDKTGRIRKPYGCPYCSGKRILVGFNDLATTHPDIASEWHPTKNEGINPTDVSSGSTRKVWWLGKCGHEWETSIRNRTRGYNCPICFKEKRSPSVMCIETGMHYKNAKEAALDVGIRNSSGIYACCRGDAKTAGGYHWRYLSD